MSTLTELWNDYWWILPLVLMLLCILGCVRGRGGEAGCGCCGCWSSPGRGRER
jgi:hypothetical protein